MANSLDFTKSQLEKLKQILEYPNDFKYPLGSKVYSNDIDFLNKQGLCGEWERVEGAFIFGASDDYPADGVVRGSANAVIIQHNHQVCGNVIFYQSGNNTAREAGTHGYSTNPGDTYYTGEDGTGKNMPPYIAKYMWIKTKLESETNGTLGVMVI